VIEKTEILEGTPISVFSRTWYEDGFDCREEVTVTREERKIVSENDREKIIEITEHVRETAGGAVRIWPSGGGGSESREYVNVYKIRVLKPQSAAPGPTADRISG
jgi:hypothetical protein